MRLLRLVGSGDDGASLILETVETDGDGERFTLPIDHRLRAAASGEPPRPPVVVGEPGPTPTPREIQVRVRAGETAQAIADEADIPLERVMRFAYPVLQERVRVTDEARRARARRGGDGQLVPFGELLDGRLSTHGIDPASVAWDAFRREDGGWTVTAEFSSYARVVVAKFSFALMNRTVSALDDIAADLLSERRVQALMPPPPPASEPVAEPTDADWDGAGPPRLTAVPNPAGREESRPQEAGPAIRQPSRRQKAYTRVVPPAGNDDELFDQDVFDQRPWHEPPLPFEAGPAGSSGAGTASAAPAPAGTAASADSADTDEPAGRSESATLEEMLGGPVEPPQAHEPVEQPDAADPVDPVGDTAATPISGDQQQRRGRRAGEKPRMPSWDDILLGVRHKSD